jgi:acetolactate synthase-1/2/3 large subunit
VAIGRHPEAQFFFPAEREISGDIPAILGSLSPGGDERRATTEWTADDVTSYRTLVDSTFSKTADDPEGTATVPDVIRRLGERLPGDTLLTVDAGFGKPIASMLWPSRTPMAYFASHGLSTMGYAIPTANALKSLRPKQTVVALLGDGSLLMSAPEIAVATTLGIAPVYIVWSDGALLQIRLKQARQGLRGVGTEIGRQSCAAIAAAFGGWGSDVDSIDQLDECLDRALESRIPSLIGVRVDHGPAARWYDALRG